MEGIEAVKAGFHLPGPEGILHPSFGNPNSGLGTEERIPRFQPFALVGLIGPKLPELSHKDVRQKNIALSATLGDFWPDSKPVSWLPLLGINIADV
jgi:hypothetical protein